MAEMRNYVYQNPNETYDTSALHERFSGSTGYFRSVYKQCFGSSFHKDCISARIAKAKYQLSTTTLSVMDISEKCGYLDSKYFLRQFSSCSGMTPIQYRNLLKS
jgi:AraC-like DNA-binding protein